MKEWNQNWSYETAGVAQSQEIPIFPPLKEEKTEEMETRKWSRGIKHNFCK